MAPMLTKRSCCLLREPAWRTGVQTRQGKTRVPFPGEPLPGHSGSPSRTNYHLSFSLPWLLWASQGGVLLAWGPGAGTP